MRLDRHVYPRVVVEAIFTRSTSGNDHLKNGNDLVVCSVKSLVDLVKPIKCCWKPRVYMIPLTVHALVGDRDQSPPEHVLKERNPT